MKIIEMEQNSEEWLEFRKGKSGGSELHKLWSPRAMSYKKHYYEMLAEKHARPITPNDYVDRLDGEPFNMMNRGHILEPEAAFAFEAETGMKLETTGVWVSDFDENIYVSPDRVIYEEDGSIKKAVEIKCPDSPVVLEFWKTKAIPKEYVTQVCQYFIVNEELEELYFVVYTDVVPGLELQYIKITRDNAEAMGLDNIRNFEMELMAEQSEDDMKLDEIAGF